MFLPVSDFFPFLKSGRGQVFDKAFPMQQVNPSASASNDIPDSGGAPENSTYNTLPKEPSQWIDPTGDSREDLMPAPKNLPFWADPRSGFTDYNHEKYGLYDPITGAGIPERQATRETVVENQGIQPTIARPEGYAYQTETGSVPASPDQGIAGLPQLQTIIAPQTRYLDTPYYNYLQAQYGMLYDPYGNYYYGGRS